MDDVVLSVEQEAEVERIVDVWRGAAEVDLRRMARLMVSRSNGEFFGETEFTIRDVVHRIAARGIDAALEERKKGGTANVERASSVPGAGATPGSTATGEPG